MKPQKRPLPPGVQVWPFGHPPARPLAPGESKLEQRQTAIDGIAEKLHREHVKDNAEICNNQDAIIEHAANLYPEVAYNESVARDAVGRIKDDVSQGERLDWRLVEKHCEEVVDDYALRPKQYHEKTDQERHAEGIQQIRDLRSGKLKVPPQWELE